MPQNSRVSQSASKSSIPSLSSSLRNRNSALSSLNPGAKSNQEKTAQYSQRLIHGSGGNVFGVMSPVSSRPPSSGRPPSAKSNDGFATPGNSSIIYHRNRGGRPRRNPAKSGLKFHVFTSSQYWQHQDYGKSRMDMLPGVRDGTVVESETKPPEACGVGPSSVKIEPPDDYQKSEIIPIGDKKISEAVNGLPIRLKSENQTDHPSDSKLELNVLAKGRKSSGRPGIEEAIKKMKNGRAKSATEDLIAERKRSEQMDHEATEDMLIMEIKQRRKRKYSQYSHTTSSSPPNPNSPFIAKPAVKVEPSSLRKNNNMSFPMGWAPKVPKKLKDLQISENGVPSSANLGLFPSPKFLADCGQVPNVMVPMNSFPIYSENMHAPASSSSAMNMFPIKSGHRSGGPQMSMSRRPQYFQQNFGGIPQTSSAQHGHLLRKALNVTDERGVAHAVPGGDSGQNFNCSLTAIPESGSSHMMTAGGFEDPSSKKRKNCRTVVRQQLEDTFKKKGFLVQTKQVSSGSATFCKFRQLNKYSRYYLKIWHKHLPDEVHKLWKGFLPPKDRRQ